MVVMLNLAVCAPAGIVTLAGMDATSELELDSATVTPPEGATAFSSTFAETTLPPMALDCPKLTAAGASGSTVSVACVAMPL